jgi:branched-chain amino acid transport system permease protein
MYEQVIAINVGLAMLLAMSLNIITGFAGQPTLGHAAFYGIGAYTSALLTAKAGWPFLLALPASGAMAALVGVLLGIFSVRVREDFLAVTTIGINFVIVAIFQYVPLFGASLGLAVPKPLVFGIRFGNTEILILLVVLNLLVYLFMRHLPNSWLGLALGGVRNDEEAAASLGFNPDHYKVFAFGIGTFIAGMTGSVYAHFMGFISSTDFSFPVSVGVLSMAVLGGLGTVSGPLLGAIILTLAPEVFRFVSDYRMLVYGGLLVLMMRFQPQGLVGDDSWLRRRWDAIRTRGKGGVRRG